MPREDDLLKRITMRPGVFGGRPTIRNMRISVEHVLENLAAGESVESLLENYPFLEREDVPACLIFAHRMIAGEQVHNRISIREAS